MVNFKKNIDRANSLVGDVFSSYDSIKNFLIEFNKDFNCYEKLDIRKKEKLEEACDLLVSNAMVTETRRMQQKHYGSVITIISESSDKLLDELKNNHEFAISFIQLLLVFFTRKDIESAAHHHDMIRKSITTALNGLITKL